jgi:hypothetical protein
MEIRVDRRARRRIDDAGGLLTVEVRAETGCMVTRRVEARAGRPPEPDGFSEHRQKGMTVFARGVLAGPAGVRPLTDSALPARVWISERDGALAAEAR